jgi:hypothetical protein
LHTAKTAAAAERTALLGQLDQAQRKSAADLR